MKPFWAWAYFFAFSILYLASSKPAAGEKEIRLKKMLVQTSAKISLSKAKILATSLSERVGQPDASF